MHVPRYISWILLLCVTAAAAAQVSPEVPETVILDASGVESRFVNPVDPIPIGRRPLLFVNNTGDRTFVVTIPFVYTATELASAYATADALRRDKLVSDVVCDALEWNKARNNPELCIDSEREEIDTLVGLRVLLEAVTAAKPTDLVTCNAQLKSADCIVEAVFWTAGCRFPDDVLLAFAREDLEEKSRIDLESYIREEAKEMLDRLLDPDPVDPDPQCDLPMASGHQARIVGKLTISATSPPLLDPIAAEAGSAGLKARFGAARVDLAKNELIKAIRTRMFFPELPNETLRDPETKKELLDEYGKPLRFQQEIRDVFRKLETRREQLTDEEESKPSAELQCRLREVEAAGRLLASYSPDASVPYSGIPRSLLGDPAVPSCDERRTKRAVAEAKAEGAARAEAMEEEQRDTIKILTERSNEQGIEITCASATACSATATIPPYQQATFSPSVLAHHTSPRIAFNVSFFGDPESPANPVGYVLRSGGGPLDAKPKNTFNLQLGGDSSFSRDPAITQDVNEPISGQLRHLSGSGTLGFQYSGPVEASATVRFNTGDFGGTASRQLETSQYQAKVYGPARVVLQVGRIPFANPSSSIAIHVFGDGLQLIMDRWNVGYVVLRESEAGTANRRNKDSEVAFALLKNEPFEWPPFRKKEAQAKPAPFFRNFDLALAYGRDKKDRAEDGSNSRPYRYYSNGGEFRWGIKRIPSLGGSFALYRSFRRVSDRSGAPGVPGNGGDGREDEDSAPPQTLLDGKGTVGLARVSWTRLTVPKLNEPQAAVRKSWGLSGFFGYGTGDDPKTATVDEGYLGESASYTNDVLFLSGLASSEVLGPKIGRGLANKRYYGAQYTDARWSLLGFATQALRAEKDIASLGTVFTVHAYEFQHAVQGFDWGGEEANLTFNIEVPKNIQWSLGAAYYWSSEALERLNVKDDIWGVTAKLSIKLNSL